MNESSLAWQEWLRNADRFVKIGNHSAGGFAVKRQEAVIRLLNY
jgi:hypothetical protein